MCVLSVMAVAIVCLAIGAVGGLFVWRNNTSLANGIVVVVEFVEDLIARSKKLF